MMPKHKSLYINKLDFKKKNTVALQIGMTLQDCGGVLFLGLQAPFLQLDNGTASAAIVVNLVLGGDADG